MGYFIHKFFYSFIDSLVHRRFIHWFIAVSFIGSSPFHSFMESFIHSFIQRFIGSAELLSFVLFLPEFLTFLPFSCLPLLAFACFTYDRLIPSLLLACCLDFCSPAASTSTRLLHLLLLACFGQICFVDSLNGL